MADPGNSGQVNFTDQDSSGVLADFTAQHEADHDAASRQATYDFIDAGRMYGGRELRTPDGRADQAHFVYTPSAGPSHGAYHSSRGPAPANRAYSQAAAPWPQGGQGREQSPRQTWVQAWKQAWRAFMAKPWL
jgi:hypothetical protein